MPNIFIQPTKQLFDKYLALANEYNFGFEIVELSKPQVLNDTLKYLKLEKFYKNKLSDFKHPISFHGAFIDIKIDSPDRLIRIASEKRIRNSVESALKLNAKRVIFHSGYNPIIKNPFYKKNFLDRSIKFWNQIINEYDIEVCLENMWDESPLVLYDIISKIDNENLKICFDPGHFNVFSKARLDDWIKILSEKISLIHISDNLGDYDSHLEVGKGNIDWKIFSQYLEIFCKSVDITYELNSIEEVAKSDKFFREYKIFPYQNKRYMSNVEVF